MTQASNSHGTDILALISRYRRHIMGFAALYILMFHEYQILFQEGSLIYEFQKYVARMGFMGVDMFLLLSGIGLTYAIRKSSVGSFYYHRLKRILFPFVVIGIIRMIVEKWDVAAFIGNITGFNFYTKSMYSFLWFVPAIASFYLLFPLYHRILRWASNKITFTGVVLCVWLLLSMIFADAMRSAGREEFYGFTNRIPVFVVGVLFGWLSQNGKIIISRLGWVLVILMNILGVYLSIQTCYHGWSLLVPVSNCCIPNLLMSISLTFLLAKLFSMMSRFKASRVFSVILGFFGMISLELYCVQEFLAKQIFTLIPNSTPFVKDLAVLAVCSQSAVILYYAGIYFWKLLELPFRKKPLPAPASAEKPEQ